MFVGGTNRLMASVQLIGIISSTVRTAMGTTAHAGSALQIEGRSDQRNIREGLGKVADQPSALDVVLFREQAQVVAQREQACKQLPGILHAADGFEGADHPEAAGQKSAL